MVYAHAYHKWLEDKTCATCHMMKKIVFISIFASSIAGTRRYSGWTTGDCDNYMSGISGGPLHQCNVQIRQMQSMPI